MNIKKGLIVLSAVLCMSGAAYAEEAEFPWIFESFEDLTVGSFERDGNATIRAIDSGAFGSSGALGVTVSGNIANGAGGYKVGTTLKNGEVYKLSFLIKAEGNIPRNGSTILGYNEEGEESKVYAVIREGTAIKQTIELTGMEWSNEEYTLCEQEFTYEGNGGKATLSLRVGGVSDMGGRTLQGGRSLNYYLDEVKLLPTGQTELVTDLECDYPPDESNMMEISYNFSGENNNSLCVFMCEEEGRWTTRHTVSIGEIQRIFDIPGEVSGKKCKIAVYPADGDVAGKPVELEINDVKLNVSESLELGDGKINAKVDLCYDAQKQVMVIICQYSSENEMLAIEYKNAQCADGEIVSVELTPELKPDTKNVKLLIWEGVDFKTSSMISLVDEMVLSK